MLGQQPSKQSRNRARIRKDSARAEQYLTEVEKAHGCARAWELRQRLERGHLTLAELLRP